MSRAKGINSRLVMAYEDAYGKTPAMAVGYKMPFNQSQITITQNFIDSTTIRERRDKEQPALGNIDVSGSIKTPIDQIGFGYWLRAMFGDPTTSDAGAQYTHVFKVAGTQPSLVLEQQYPDISAYEMYNGCKINNFAFTYGSDDELVANFNIIGAKRTISAVPFTSSLSDIVLQKFSSFQGTIEEGGVPLGIVTQASLNADFGLDGNTYTIGSGGYRTALPEGILQVSGTIKAFFADTVLLNKAVTNTPSSLKFKFTSGASSLEFFMEEVVFEQTSPGIVGEQGISIQLPFRAFYDKGVGGSIMVAKLVNEQAAYTV